MSSLIPVFEFYNKYFLSLIQNCCIKLGNYKMHQKINHFSFYPVSSFLMQQFSLLNYPSICLPKNPAAVAASFISISPNLALGSRLKIATAPMASPSQRMAVTTWAVTPSSSSVTRGMKFLSSFPAHTDWRSLISCSNCLLIFF